MVTPRAARIRDAIGHREPPATDVGPDRVFVWNYQLHDADVDDWHMVSTRRTCLPDGLCLGRSAWQRPGGSADDLLLVEWYECATRESAHDVLVELLATFEVPRDFAPDPDSPAGFQLVDADGTNALIAVGNLVLRVSSGGSEPIPARLVSRQLIQRVATRPERTTARAAPTTSRRRKRLAVGDSIAIEPGRRLGRRDTDTAEAAPSLKLFARGGQVRVVDDEIVFVAEEPGDAAVECYSAGDDDSQVELVRLDVAVVET
jgi:hypothetical protein